MARVAFMIVAASILMGCTIVAEALSENPAEAFIHVGGKVLCQDCTKGWNEWVHGGKPIQGSVVSITCFDKGRVTYCGRDETDIAGKFDIPIKKYIKGKEVNVKECFVRLVSSPDPTCNILTNFGGGRSGVKLFRPISDIRGLIKYELDRPFYFTSPMCDEPDTNESDSEQPKPNY